MTTIMDTHLLKEPQQLLEEQQVKQQGKQRKEMKR